MKRYYELIKKSFSMAYHANLAMQIYSLESSFCYRDFARSSRLCLEELKKAGAENVELIPHKADGETTYGDFIMPEAWDVDEASLEVVEPAGAPAPVLADLKKHPFAVANRCASTPEQGVVAEVLTLDEARRRKRLDGKLVFVQDTSPRYVRGMVLEKNGIGIISAYSGAKDAPDGILWINGWCTGSGWYHTKEDKKLLCFSITPRIGEVLQSLLKSSRSVHVRARVRSRIYAGEISTVTGLLPGRSDEEILFVAHLYEPMLTDNATSVAALIEACRVLKRLLREGSIPPLKRGIRFLFSMERYGVAAFFEKRRENIRAALNVDSITPDITRTGMMHLSLCNNPYSNPFFGDFIFEHLLEHCFPPEIAWRRERPEFGDDSFIADSSIGIPTNYFMSHPGKLHHSSLEAEVVDWNLGREMAVVMTTYAYLLAAGEEANAGLLEAISYSSAKSELLSFFQTLANALTSKPGALTAEEAEERAAWFTAYLKKKLSTLRAFGYNLPDTVMQEIDETSRAETQSMVSRLPLKKEKASRLSRQDKKAENIVIVERERVFPFSLSRVPRSKRRDLPHELAAVLNWVDGKNDLSQIFKFVDFERELFSQGALVEAEKKSLIEAVQLLAQYGYLKLRYRVVLTKEEIENGLRNLGVKPGEKVIIHSSLSSFGYVEGGAMAACEAFMELITEEGVILMPSFNHGAAFAEGAAGYYSPLETPTTNGAVPDTFWRMRSVYRSLNPTHPFAAWGKDAKEYVKNDHKGVTMGEGSPLHLLEKNGGKIILIDTPSANTYHHVVETTNGAPCLGRRTEEYPVKLPSGEVVKVRTWSWRNAACKITDEGAYLEWMREHKALTEGKVGNATVFILDMNLCRRAIEGFLRGEVEGFPGCRTCTTRPRVTPRTVKSDWDEETKTVRRNTTAYTGDYLS